MRTKHSIKSVLSGVLAAVMTIGAMPAISVSAAQVNEYIDPADVWITSNGRTNELDFNATITQETAWCPVCNKDTINLTYRTPEYTKSGSTALNRGVQYSDGTMTDGVTKGNVDDGRPGVDATYSTYHWTKSVCQICGTINSVDGEGSYSFGKNVYGLNSCDHDFFLDFDNTTYTTYDSEYHTTTLKKGQYCQFCKGTKARATDKKERHNVDETVDGELGNQRFHITGECDDCGYDKSEYVAAKSVVQSYYGKVDGQAHSVTVNDLSEDGVHTKIRYGTEADECNETSAPNYTEEGYYPVYYEIDYSYAGENMTENGVSYVWLLADDNSNSSDNTSTNSVHVHDYRYIETVRPTCTELGYDRFQCSECGALQKMNYVPATGHDYNTVAIREASCQQGGLELHSCKNCGSFYTESTSMTDHHYQTNVIPSTCTMNGYTEHTCIDCGYRYITDLTPLAKHDYRDTVTAPTCTTRGFTTHACANCDDIYISDYTEATGHEWDNGTVITSSTCDSEGVKEFHCKHCDEKMIQAISATGHKPGTPATCTEAQTCESCGAVLELPTGHHYSETVTPPSCSAMGFTTFTCDDCGASYIGNYTDKTAHHYVGVITSATCTELGYTTYTCSECGDEYKSDYVDKTEHHYHIDVTAPTCTAMGYSTYTCHDCGVSFVADYIDVVPHNYTKQVVEPTCTEQGYTVYTCPDCGKEFIGDEQETIEHSFNAIVTEPKCEEMGFTTYTCDDCGYSYVDDYTNPTGHHYDEVVTASTCTEIGYTTYTCVDCGKSYTGNETAKIEHAYDKAVTEPTCTSMGFTVFTCKDCGDTYTGDYTDVLPHNYKEVVTAPTCSEIGFSTFTCEDCGKSYQGNETAKIPHNYDNAVTEPTCTSMGFTTYTCPDCGDTYTADYTDMKGHDYETVVTTATCTSIGYTTYICKNCGNTYIADETAKAAHNYEITVTESTCTELGYSTYTCKDCGETYRADEVAAKGHNTSDWIIDTPATIEHSGEKHKECTVCGEVLENAEIPQLTDKDNSDEDGHSKVGDYSILITDKDNKPIFDSEISIDRNDNITIKLPDGRLLSAEDITTITVTNSENQQAAKDINIFIADTKNNAATGKTDENGQLRVPNAQSSTGSSNGTVADKENTYVVVVTDKNGVLIPNCTVTVGENFSIDVKLPDGTAFDKDNRITVTTVTEKGEPVKGLRVQLIGDGDFVENGYTNINGQITLPMSNSDITDGDGKGEVGEINGDKIYVYIVTVSDEKGMIENALITLISDDNSVLVCLPHGKVIDYFNRTTIKVVRSDGTPVSDWKVSVYNKDGSGLRTEVTDENGIVIVPPLSEAPISKPTPTPNPDEETKPLPGVEVTPAPGETEKPTETDKPGETDKPSEPTPTPGETEKPSEPTPTPDLGDGSVVQNKNYKYRVYVWDNDGVITEFGLIKLQDNGDLVIELPENKLLDENNKTYVKVVNENDGTAVKAITVNVSDVKGGKASDITNSYGIAVVPVSDTDTTDIKGNAQVKDNEGNLYNVNVSTDEKGAIEGAVVKAADGKITVTLPDGTTINYKDRTTVTVSDRDNKPVSDMPVNVKDNAGGNRTENTDKNGAVVVPQRNEFETDDKGDTGEIPVPTPTPNPDATPELTDDPTSTDDPNATPTPTEKPITKLNVKVEDESGIIENAVVVRGDNNELTVKLPDGKTLDKDNRIKVTVTNQDNEPLEGIKITVTDNIGGTDTDTTNKAGYIIVPVIENDNTDDKGGIVEENKDDVKTQYTVIVENNDSKIANAAVMVADGKISVTLPDTHTLTTSNQTKVTVLDKDAQPVKGVSVTVTDKNNKTATKTTDANGQILVPVKTSGGGGGGSSSGGGGGSYISTNTTNVKVTDKNGKTVNVSKSIDKDGKVILTLPTGKTLDGDNYYTIITTDRSGKPKADVDITLKDKNGKSADGATDKDGKLILPADEHKSYIVGYEDGEFKPENNMTRAEAAAIFARNIAERKGESITNKKSSFKDVNSNLWYSKYIAYLEKYDIIEGYDDSTFKSEENITRAEFVTMCARFYNLFDKTTDAKSNKFTDVASPHWAYKFINSATAMDWIRGYADGSFKPDNNITRAEVVAIVNRVTDREADTEYVNKNLSSLNRFDDLTDTGYWAYYPIIEAANTHKAVTNADGEFWVK